MKSKYVYWTVVTSLVVACVIPTILPTFWTVNIFAKALCLGVIALSLSFLTGYCGMVSLAQMSVAGMAGYIFALLSPNVTGMGIAMPWPVATVCAVAGATALGALIGLISARSSDVYLLMLTLAIGVSMQFFVQQNMDVFNGFDGITGIQVPSVSGVSLRDPLPLYYLSLAVTVIALGFVVYLQRTPFGLALQAVRDNPRRLAAVGCRVISYKVAAFAVAGFIAGVGGVLNCWYNAQVAPGSLDVAANVSILVICVLGGLGRPAGAFIGAIAYVLLENFAVEVIDRERFNLVIGLAFLLTVMFSPKGIIGAVSKILSVSSFREKQSGVQQFGKAGLPKSASLSAGKNPTI